MQKNRLPPPKRDLAPSPPRQQKWAPQPERPVRRLANSVCGGRTGHFPRSRPLPAKSTQYSTLESRKSMRLRTRDWRLETAINVHPGLHRRHAQQPARTAHTCARRSGGLVQGGLLAICRRGCSATARPSLCLMKAVCRPCRQVGNEEAIHLLFDEKYKSNSP